MSPKSMQLWGLTPLFLIFIPVQSTCQSYGGWCAFADRSLTLTPKTWTAWKDLTSEGVAWLEQKDASTLLGNLFSAKKKCFRRQPCGAIIEGLEEVFGTDSLRAVAELSKWEDQSVTASSYKASCEDDSSEQCRWYVPRYATRYKFCYEIDMYNKIPSFADWSKDQKVYQNLLWAHCFTVDERMHFKNAWMVWGGQVQAVNAAIAKGDQAFAKQAAQDHRQMAYMAKLRAQSGGHGSAEVPEGDTEGPNGVHETADLPEGDKGGSVGGVPPTSEQLRNVQQQIARSNSPGRRQTLQKEFVRLQKQASHDGGTPSVKDHVIHGRQPAKAVEVTLAQEQTREAKMHRLKVEHTSQRKRVNQATALVQKHEMDPLDAAYLVEAKRAGWNELKSKGKDAIKEAVMAEVPGYEAYKAANTAHEYYESLKQVAEILQGDGTDAAAVTDAVEKISKISELNEELEKNTPGMSELKSVLKYTHLIAQVDKEARATAIRMADVAKNKEEFLHELKAAHPHLFPEKD